MEKNKTDQSQLTVLMFVLFHTNVKDGAAVEIILKRKCELYLHCPAALHKGSWLWSTAAIGLSPQH